MAYLLPILPTLTILLPIDKVIDPEFTVFAPPGLDAGSLMSGFVLAHLYHTQQGLPEQRGLPPTTPASTPASTPSSQRAEGSGEGEAGAGAEGGPRLGLCAALRELWASYEATLRAEGVSPSP